jgi:hypothetical protein
MRCTLKINSYADSYHEGEIKELRGKFITSADTFNNCQTFTFGNFAVFRSLYGAKGAGTIANYLYDLAKQLCKPIGIFDIHSTDLEFANAVFINHELLSTCTYHSKGTDSNMTLMVVEFWDNTPCDDDDDDADWDEDDE